MATQVQEPIALDLVKAQRADVGRPVRYWQFVNRSSYYVFIAAGWSESTVLSDPDHVLEPYTSQRVTFLEPTDKIVWQANVAFPQAVKPPNALDLFGFMASDRAIDAEPAAVLAVQADVSAEVMTRLEDTQRSPGNFSILIKSGVDGFDRFRVDNLGRVLMGAGTDVARLTFDVSAGQLYRLACRRQMACATTEVQTVTNYSYAAGLGTFFESVRVQSAGVWTDYTAAVQSVGGTEQYVSALGAEIYYGMTNAPFRSVWLDFSTVATSGGPLAVEYWDGFAWSMLPYTEGVPFTLSGRADGYAFWTAPDDWAKTTIDPLSGDATSRYWVRMRVLSPLSPIPILQQASQANESSSTTGVQYPPLTVHDISGIARANIAGDGTVNCKRVVSETGGWTALTLGAGVSATPTQATPSWRREGGRIFLRGGLVFTGTPTAGTTVWATLPVGARPQFTKDIAAGFFAGAAFVGGVGQILASGILVHFASLGANPQMYLDGMSFDLV